MLKLKKKYIIRGNTNNIAENTGEQLQTPGFNRKPQPPSQQPYQPQNAFFIDQPQQLQLSILSRRSQQPQPVIANFDGQEILSSFVIGSNFIPPCAKVSWNVKLNYNYKNNSFYNSFYVGVAPFDIDQNDSNVDNRVIYIDSTKYFIHSQHGSYDLFSGIYESLQKLSNGTYHPPHKTNNITVVVNTQKRKVSFIIGGITYGTVHQIPLDKPLVPFVAIAGLGNSAELEII